MRLTAPLVPAARSLLLAVLADRRLAARAGAAEDHHQLPDAQRRVVAALHREGRRLLPEVRPRRGPAVRRAPDRRRDADERPGGDGEPLARAGHGGRHPRRQRVHADGQLVEQGALRADRAEGLDDPRQLKGKRIAVGQIGDAPYNYTVALLGTLRPRRPRRAVDSGRHRRQRPRRGAPDQPRRRHAADRAQLLPARRGRLQESREPRRPPDVFAATVYLFAARRRPPTRSSPSRSSRRTPKPSSASTTTRRSP